MEIIQQLRQSLFPLNSGHLLVILALSRNPETQQLIPSLGPVAKVERLRLPRDSANRSQ